MFFSIATTFPLFALLPAEIQLQIWDSTVATLRTAQMHIFDVQASPPPPRTASSFSSSSSSAPLALPRPALSRRRAHSRSKSPGRGALKPRTRSKPAPPRNATTNLTTVSLVAFTPPPTTLDPSAYAIRTVLRQTTVDAARAADRAEAAIPPADRATIALAHDRRPVVYDNARDVLHLRFLPPRSNSSSRYHNDLAVAAPLSAIFQALWAPALASALHGARRVAIDVAQIWPALAAQQQRLVQDVVFLVCTLQNALEVLYLVDYSKPGGGAVAKTLGCKNSELYARLHSCSHSEAEWEAEQARKGDVIRGIGTVWREVLDLEGLGWHEQHPGFVFGKMFAEVVRLQQERWLGEGEKKTTFQGVRVLVVDNELDERMDSTYTDES